MSEHPKDRGEISEAAVRYHFVAQGIPVLEPFGDNKRYDFVCKGQNEFFRVQVKTGRLSNGRVQFETRSSGSKTRRIAKEGYEGEIEVFAVFSYELDETFIVPIDEAPETTMGLRIQEPGKPSSTINWADDYRLADWIDSMGVDS